MKNLLMVVTAFLLLLCLWSVLTLRNVTADKLAFKLENERLQKLVDDANEDDQESQMLKDYEKENQKLRLLAERRELQFKIATYESKLNIRVAKPVDPNE